VCNPEVGPVNEDPEQLVRDPRLAEAVDLFNRREFFACHDVLEELWNETLGEERSFYQGLIHAAVALFHFGEGNLGGARRMYSSAVRYLDPYRPRYFGVDVEALLAGLKGCFRELLAARDGYPAGVVLVDQAIPVIELHAEVGHG
jgi:predicted metal-dependent hydrolase